MDSEKKNIEDVLRAFLLYELEQIRNQIKDGSLTVQKGAFPMSVVSRAHPSGVLKPSFETVDEFLDIQSKSVAEGSFKIYHTPFEHDISGMTLLKRFHGFCKKLDLTTSQYAYYSSLFFQGINSNCNSITRLGSL